MKLRIKNLRKYRRIFVLAFTLPIVVILGIALFFSLRNASPASAVWMNDAWAYRVKIPVTAHTSPETNVYFTKTIDTSDTSKFQTDCGDLRFTDINGDLLQYYIASGCSSASTVIHVLVPSFPAGASDYYYYYGNPTAPNGFSGSDFTAGTGVTVGSVGSEEKSKGPVGYWSFDEGSGTSANDTSTNHNTGVLTNGPTWKTAENCLASRCVKLDGTTQYIKVNDPTNKSLDFGSSTDFTLSVWVRANSLANTPFIIDKRHTYGTAVPGYTLYLDTSGRPILRLADGSSVNEWTAASGNYADQKWHLYSISASRAGTTRLYVDGAQVATADISAMGSLTTTNSLDFGTKAAVSTNALNGFLDEVKIYNYARTAAEVKADFAARGGAKGVSSAQGTGNQKFLSDGLVGYWKMDETNWTNDCSTGSVLDSSGAGNNGASCPNSTGPTGAAAGKFGTSGSLDGINDEIKISGSTSLLPSGALSIGVWVNISTTTANFMITNRGDPNAVFPWAWFYYDGLNARFVLRKGDGSSIVTPVSSISIEDSTWHHIGFSASVGQPVSFYVDGSLIDVPAGSYTETASTLASHPFEIGAQTVAGTPADFFSGKIDELRVYKRALSAQEFRQLYNFTPGPVGYWKMDENTGQTVSDSSGNGFSGVLGDSGSSEPDDPLWAPGKFGASTSFTADPADRHIRVEDNALLNISSTGNMTISAWVRRTGNAEFDNAMVLVDKQDAGSSAGYGFRLAAPDCGTASSAGDFVCFFVYDGSDTYEVVTTTTLTADSTWHYVTAVFDRTSASNIDIFFDGIAQPVTRTGTLASIGSALNTDPLCIGVDQDTDCDSNLNQFNGNIDDLKIYNYARTPGQITEDMNGSHPLGGSPVGSQIAMYQLDEQQGQTINNGGNQGSAMNGTLGANTGVASDDPTWKTAVDCKSNGCLSFDGTNDYAQVTDLSARMDNSSLSMSAWVYPTSTSANQHLIGIRNDGSADFYLVMLSGGTSVEARFRNSGATAYTITATSSLTLNTWQHIALTYDGTTLTYFKDGKAMNTLAASGTITDTAANFGIGGDGDDGNNPFTGKIDGVKVYTDALSKDQIALDYNASAAVNYGSNAAIESSQLTDGAGLAPIAHWSLDEKNGTTANDTSGNGKTGTLTGGPLWSSGKVGAALKFDGSDDHVNVGNTINLSGNTAMTLSAWIYPTATPGANGAQIISKYDRGNAGEWRFLVQNTNELQFLRECGGFAITSLTTISLNTWTHISASYDGTNQRLYINGRLDRTSAMNCSVTGNAIEVIIGAGDNGSGVEDLFTGTIDDVTIYNYARTAAQIAYDYNRGAPVGRWRFDECSGTLANDSSGNGNTGTITPGGAPNTAVGTCNSGSASDMWNDGAAGKFNGSLGFDATNDSVVIPSSSTIDLNNGVLSLSAWIKWNGGGSSNYIIDKASNKYNLSLAGAAGKPTFYVAGFSGLLTAPTAITSGAWHHIVGTYDGTTANLYVDGQSSTSQVTGASISTGGSLYLGCFTTCSSTYSFDGQIDDVQIFNYALSPTQVKKLYNGGVGVNFGPLTGQP